MKITIPEEYVAHFPSETMWLNLKDKKECATKEYAKVFIVRWRNSSLLLLNEAEHDRFKESVQMNIQEKPDAHGIVSFINAGVQITLLREGVIDVPEYLSSWLEGDDRTVTKEKMGLLVR